MDDSARVAAGSVVRPAPGEVWGRIEDDSRVQLMRVSASCGGPLRRGGQLFCDPRNRRVLKTENSAHVEILLA